MDSPAPDEELGLDSEIREAAHTKTDFDAERIRSSVAQLASTSVDDLEKLTSELKQLQDFLKSETKRVQGQIGDVLTGIGIIIETITPWKITAAASVQNTHTNGRDRLKRWP